LRRAVICRAVSATVCPWRAAPAQCAPTIARNDHGAMTIALTAVAAFAAADCFRDQTG
jgi:hypothetical protein